MKDTVLIPLRNSDLFAIVDADDAAHVLQFDWYLDAKGYAAITVPTNGICGRTLTMHRMVTGIKKASESLVDHVDRNRLNNTKANLRHVTPAQNACNVSVHKDKKSSKFKGVSWHKDRKQYQATICKNYKQDHLGFFGDDQVAAARAYDKASLELHGPYGVRNFPDETHE